MLIINIVITKVILDNIESKADNNRTLHMTIWKQNEVEKQHLNPNSIKHFVQVLENLSLTEIYPKHH